MLLKKKLTSNIKNTWEASTLLGWQQSHLVFFFMIFKASLLIQITNINQLYIDHFVR